jgi:FAD/FMN-containing dehydrogenase
MQSYNNFTIGGSLSVNVHSRTIKNGALIETVESIKLMLANGSIVYASRTENADLFAAAIGGYGAIGIILEATLHLADNENIKKQEILLPLEQYVEFFNAMIKHNSAVVFHNANISVDSFNKVMSLTWYKTDEPCTIEERLQHNHLSWAEYVGFQLARYMKGIQKIRVPFQALNNAPCIVRRNYEMSSSVNAVEPMTRFISTTILQEYFIPSDQLLTFLEHLKTIVSTHKVNLLNLSIRSIHRDTESIMAYAQAEESFSVVCYINMMNNSYSMHNAEVWTRKVIDQALACGGTYYLPYQLHATHEQFERAYPRFKELLSIKKQVDPHHRFMNTFLQRYMIV